MHTYRPTHTDRRAHRGSAAQRTGRRRLQVRDRLVRMRTPVIHLMRGQLRSAGLRMRSCRTETFVTRYHALEIPAACARCSRRSSTR